jgi:molecular chaperone GrpE
MTKSKKQTELEQQIGELTQDLQRTRADFENYRKRADEEKARARETGATSMIMKLLPVVDTIERAIDVIPQDLAENQWVKGIAGVGKQLTKQLDALEIKKIDATPGAPFNPDIHQAVQFDEESEGETEVIAEELQPGYTLNGVVIRHAMVKVVRK